ncbi:hypothetical protein HRG_009609 [Hirsutella rhossiliensis]|uniref:Uncharacterized protein n=1 Tax=Hirsutella rhossiliensis TaxID=111463 RepID=A0A9P8SDV4_9HYPO|nr:uncharacterized protein HRG_09609 [Hirsutella rhossiliensis]KAH0959148.1 hypothetical protein HRG_09609 [Hirsutella rhossiliensis]
MKLLPGLAFLVGVAPAAQLQGQKPLTGGTDFKPWMPPAGALSDREFERLCGTMMSESNPRYLTEGCQGTAEWCLGRLYAAGEFDGPETCLASRRRKPWRDPAPFDVAERRCANPRAEECVGTERWCSEQLWNGTGDLFSGPKPCLASREPKPRTVARPKRDVVRETWAESVPVSRGRGRA